MKKAIEKTWRNVYDDEEIWTEWERQEVIIISGGAPGVKMALKDLPILS